jgi:hypothetical protein
LTNVPLDWPCEINIMIFCQRRVQMMSLACLTFSAHFSGVCRAWANQKPTASSGSKTIDNFQKKGVRAEELDCSNVMPDLALQRDEDEEDQFTAMELASLCYFKDLRIAVIPEIESAQRQLNFTSAPARALKRTKKLPKAQTGQVREVAEFDRILGYRIEQVMHQALWGSESHWQAVTHDGQLISDSLGKNTIANERCRDCAGRQPRQTAFPKTGRIGSLQQLLLDWGQRLPRMADYLAVLPGNLFIWPLQDS